MEKIFITGVSSGLGHGLAKVYLEQGNRVYGCSRRAPDDLIAQGLHWASVDLSNSAQAATDAGRLLADAGHFHRVILNAGKLGLIRDMKDTPYSDLIETMDVNVFANKMLLDLLFASGRKIKQVVAISSGLQSPAAAAGMATAFQKPPSIC